MRTFGGEGEELVGDAGADWEASGGGGGRSAELDKLEPWLQKPERLTSGVKCVRVCSRENSSLSLFSAWEF